MAIGYYFFIYRNPSKPPADSPIQTTAPVEGAVELKAPEAVVEAVPSEGGGPMKEAAEAYKAGDYSKAIGILREATRSGSTEAAAALPRVLNAAAVKEYERGAYDNARALLEEALASSVEEGDVTLIRLNLAKVELRLGDYERALKTLAPASADPSARELMKHSYKELGIRSERAGDIGGATSYYEKALELDPGDPFVKDALTRTAGADPGMTRKEGGHFIVRFEGGENAVAGYTIGLLLEEAYLKVGFDLGYHPEDRVETLLYSKERFRDVTDSPSWAGAIYDGRIKIPAGGITDRTVLLEKVIFHEYTHAVIHRLSGGRAPTWLNEGLAQYEEGKSDTNYAEDLKGFASSGDVSLRALEGSFLELPPERARRAYLLSLSAVSYLVREFGFSQARGVLTGLREGMTLDEAMKANIYMSYEDFERSWLKSLR